MEKLKGVHMVKIELNHPEQWIKLFDTITLFTADIQNEELMVVVEPNAGAEVNEQAALFNRLRDEICPEIIQEASEIAKFLKDNEQRFMPDPAENMYHTWDTFAKEAVPQFDEEIKYNKDLAGAVSNFWNSIGEAMGPVCYEGFKLKEALVRAVLPKDWVDKCIKYYEDNWKF